MAATTPDSQGSGTHGWKKTSVIRISTPADQLNPLIDYIISTLERNPYLSHLSRSSAEGGALLTYRLTSAGGELLDVAVTFTPERIYINYAPYPPDSMSEDEYLHLDLEFEKIVRSYIQDQSKASLFLVFSPKMTILPGKKEKGIKKLLASVVFGNMLYLFAMVLLIGIFLYQFFGYYTPLLLVAIQFVVVFFASNLIAARGEFDVTADNPSIHVAELRMKRDEFEQIVRTCIPKIQEVKKRIYDSTLAIGRELDQNVIVQTLNQYGSVCTPEFVKIKSVDIYSLVKGLGSKFGFKEPRITLLNVMPPNAAATGISPKRATVLVTSGLIAMMDKKEIETVLAHEFSHVKARDPLILLALATTEYLTRVYLFWPLLSQFGFFVDIVYLFFSFTVLFFIAKFLEARADLDAGLMTGEPRILAESLRKLGLYKYQSRVFELVNSGEWLNWDPHPPLYYRIRTLESIDLSRVRHPFISAIVGCIRGFLASLRGRYDGPAAASASAQPSASAAASTSSASSTPTPAPV